MRARSIRLWGWLHKWSSLVCTLFMLLLCVTGLPLIFSAEIDTLSGSGFTPAKRPAGTAQVAVDEAVNAASKRYPGLVPLYLFADADHPDLWYLKLDTRVDTDERKSVLLAVDASNGAILGAPEIASGVMPFIYRLHVDLFAGLAGKLFLGLMGMLLLVSLISGAVLYAPFMRKLDFGVVRCARGPRVRWVDLHNLLGIVTLTWVLVVGVTGVVNTWADLILKAWQAEQVAELHAGRTQLLLEGDGGVVGTDSSYAPAQHALSRALATTPGMRVGTIAWPGTLLATPSHFAVILYGDTALTSRLSQSILVDPVNGDVLQAGLRPWYVTAFELSQPLHFGNYGGLSFKFVWALIDLLTIIVLGSGLYLWLARSRHQVARPVLIAGVASRTASTSPSSSER